MRRILLTGMSGTGKSTLVSELAARGYRAVDLDSDAYSEWAPYTEYPGVPEPDQPELEWIWRTDRIRALLETEDADVLVVSGCASNMAQFYPRFDHIVLLSAPAAVIAERLASRTGNLYGKDPAELARVLGHIESVEPLLRRGATCEIDTRAPVEEVVRVVLSLVDAGR